MTAAQTGALNAEILRNLGTISEHESVLNRVAKYLRRVVKEINDDDALMTKEEFNAMIERGEQAFERGECTRLQPGESVTEMLRRSGYDQ